VLEAGDRGRHGLLVGGLGIPAVALAGSTVLLAAHDAVLASCRAWVMGVLRWGVI
jgi:hypothetical protein